MAKLVPARPTGRQYTLWLLRSQLLLSGGLIVGGGSLALLRTGRLPDHTVALGQLLPGMLAGDATAWLTAGFLLLILMPVQRLLTTAALFARERDWLFVGVAAIVLMIVVAGLVIEHR